MPPQFWPCPGCSRHVRRGDTVCPFCGGANDSPAATAPIQTIAGRLSRAALFAAGAVGAAVATTDCSTSAQPLYGGSFAQPLYGGSFVPEDSGVSDAASDAGEAGAMQEGSTSTGPGMVSPAYGGAVPLYGGPVLREE